MTGSAAVVGGGIAGLATAALLARDGWEVTLFEARADLGGRAGSWERDGFRFDTGPSWYLMPEVFEHFFRLLGTTADAELDLVPLTPAYRVYPEPTDGAPSAPVDVVSGRDEIRALFEQREPGSGARLDAYLDSAGEAYELAVSKFLYDTYQGTAGLRDREVVRRLPQLAPSALCRPYHLADPTTALGALAAALLAVSLVVTAHNLLEARQLRQQADSALAESLAEEARARSLQGATPRLPLPTDALKADFAQLTALQPFSASLMTFLHSLADALDTLPGVELTTLEWALTPDTPQPGATALIELRLPAARSARPDLIQHVVATLHRHLGTPAHGQVLNPPDEQGPLHSPGGQADSDGRRLVRLELPVSAP